MQKKYYSNFDEILSDPHAFSDPIQELNVSNGREGYLEIEGIYRAKGKVSVTWANTYFHEINATQELKVDVSESGEYVVTLRALGVPAARDGSRLRSPADVAAPLKYYIIKLKKYFLFLFLWMKKTIF